jgi:hypothetical protein
MDGQGTPMVPPSQTALQQQQQQQQQQKQQQQVTQQQTPQGAAGGGGGGNNLVNGGAMNAIGSPSLVHLAELRAHRELAMSPSLSAYNLYAEEMRGTLKDHALLTHAETGLQLEKVIGQRWKDLPKVGSSLLPHSLPHSPPHSPPHPPLPPPPPPPAPPPMARKRLLSTLEPIK